MISVVIATYGSDEWKEAAWTWAYPSVTGQGRGIDQIVVHHEPDGTLASARNQAASAASGEWICFLDADDQLGHGFVDHMVDKLRWCQERNELLVPAIQYTQAGKCVGDAVIPSWGRSLIEINCAVIGTLIRKDTFDRVGGFRDAIPIYEDWDLWLRAVIAGAELTAVPDAVYCASCLGGGRNSGPLGEETYWRIRREHEAAFRKIR